jgi:dihydroorotate dehydrogenase
MGERIGITRFTKSLLPANLRAVSSIELYQKLLRPLLFWFDPEFIHHLAIWALKHAGRAMTPLRPQDDQRNERTVFGVKFPNPVGVAAGLDKNAVALPAWEALGFGFVEVGTITARAQLGNPKPRIFRVPESMAIINRLGFNNDGCDVVADRLRHLRETEWWPRIPVGINLGKSRDTPLDEAVADYLLSFERLQHLGDYFVLNVSSPNTPGLRQLQDRVTLEELIRSIQERNSDGRPMLVKIAPDLEFDAIEDIISLSHDTELSGIIATNTTLDHSSIPAERRTQGGLSGAPLRQRSTEIVRFITSRTSLPVIAVGGIMSADDAMEKFDAGAALIQLYTGFIYEGPGLVRQIVQRCSGKAA